MRNPPCPAAAQVLGNAELRARYDQHGAEGLDVNFMDSAEFFAMLFGNDLFEHLVGELMITASARHGGELTAGELRRMQDARVQRLTVNVKAMLRRHVEGDAAGFRLAHAAEAQRLVNASFGESMLHAIGRVYELQAEIQLGGFFGGALAKMRAGGESINTQVSRSINQSKDTISAPEMHQLALTMTLSCPQTRRWRRPRLRSRCTRRSSGWSGCSASSRRQRTRRRRRRQGQGQGRAKVVAGWTPVAAARQAPAAAAGGLRTRPPRRSWSRRRCR